MVKVAASELTLVPNGTVTSIDVALSSMAPIAPTLLKENVVIALFDDGDDGAPEDGALFVLQEIRSTNDNNISSNRYAFMEKHLHRFELPIVYHRSLVGSIDADFCRLPG